MNDTNGHTLSARPYQRHKFTAALKARYGSKAFPVSAVDKRTRIGRALHAWRAELLADLGGAEELSAAKLALVDVACRSKLLLDSVDGYLLTMPRLWNARTRALFPLVRERQQLANGFQMTLQALGLEKRKPPALSLALYADGKYGTGNGGGTRGAVEGENTESVTNGVMETTILRRETGVSMTAASEEGESTGSVDAAPPGAALEATGATIAPPHDSEAEACEESA